MGRNAVTGAASSSGSAYCTRCRTPLPADHTGVRRCRSCIDGNPFPAVCYACNVSFMAQALNPASKAVCPKCKRKGRGSCKIIEQGGLGCSAA
jgi:hypothetical protein